MPHYRFDISIGADGDTPEEAWEEAVSALAMDPGPCPEEDEYTIEDDEDTDEEDE